MQHLRLHFSKCLQATNVGHIHLAPWASLQLLACCMQQMEAAVPFCSVLESLFHGQIVHCQLLKNKVLPFLVWLAEQLVSLET